MNSVANLTQAVRHEGDPTILSVGTSSRDGADRLAWALGWFSIALGVSELFAARTLTRALGIEGKEGLVRAYGVREIGAGMLTLSVDKEIGLQSRVAGDALDLTTLVALGSRSTQPSNLAIAFGAVLGVTLLDIAGAFWVRERASRSDSETRSYANRSGYPKGLEQTRSAAQRVASEAKRVYH